jgi:Peptidase MA superfamily
LSRPFRRLSLRLAAFAISVLATRIAVAPAAAAPPREPPILLEGVPASSPLRTLLADETRAAYREARGWFGTDVEGPMTIAWVTEPSELAARAGGDPGPVAGLAIARQGLIVLYAPALQSRPDRIRGVLRHEVCHLVFAAATARADLEPPRWLNEGVAMRWSGEWDLGNSYLSDQAKLLRDAGAAGQLMPLQHLETSFPSGPFFHVAYAQSRSFVDWMVRRGGEDALLAFIDRLGEDEDPEPAFEAVFGLPLADAEEAWRKGIGGGVLGRVPVSAMVNAGWGLLGLLVVVRFVVVRRRLRRALDEPDDGPLDSAQ